MRNLIDNSRREDPLRNLKDPHAQHTEKSMFKTSIGAFDGKSWEGLCQLVFKNKFASDGYQHIPASPGDFGLEGYCSATGIAFQCYCPDNHYTKAELYAKQRDKITSDIKKLSIYKDEIGKLLGSTKIREWRFVTPEIGHNDLILHAKTKEAEVRSWGLPFIDPAFCITLHDAGYYLLEINAFNYSKGQGLIFPSSIIALPVLDGLPEIYEENVLRKSRARLAAKASSPVYAELLESLRASTLSNFLSSDGYFREMDRIAPALFFRLVTLIAEFEHHVQEQAATWTGTPESLTTRIRDELQSRLCRLGSEVTDETADRVVRHMVARWLAICTLDYV